jgi:hypothetical protein
MMRCKNEQCKWYETDWTVQVNQDGSIPAAGEGMRQRKRFPGVSPELETRIKENIQMQLEAETRPGGLELPPGSV